MKKTILSGMLVFSLVALMIVGGTMAWFTDDQEVNNTFTAGTVKIEVNEGDFTSISNWNPGDVTEKNVTVTSLGSKKTYVRVKITPEWSKFEGEDMAPSADNVILHFASNYADNWAFPEDGWYYYKSILNEGEETALLLDTVELDGESTGNEYQGRTLTVKVEAEAVQASHEAYKSAWNLTELPDEVEVWSE